MTRSQSTSASHTPGPWRVDPTHSLCIESDKGNIAIVNLARSSEADARLIAAAPELLALLREAETLAVLGDIEETTEAHGWGEWLKNTRAILAKVVRP